MNPFLVVVEHKECSLNIFWAIENRIVVQAKFIVSLKRGHFWGSSARFSFFLLLLSLHTSLSSSTDRQQKWSLFKSP